MRKRFSILIILCGLFLVGCDNKDNLYDEFEHYNLNENNKLEYTFHDDNDVDTYAVADITKEIGDVGGSIGIFYKISDNDYILLDQIDGIIIDDEFKTSDVYFYQHSKDLTNKLYISFGVGHGTKREYIFNDEEFKVRELNFDTSKISNEKLEYPENYNIEKVTDEDIYYEVDIHNTYDKNVSIKCSLNDNKCVFNK